MRGRDLSLTGKGFVCRSRTRESLESLGGKVPVRPKSYDFGYRFRHRQSLDPDEIDPSLRQVEYDSDIESFSIGV